MFLKSNVVRGKLPASRREGSRYTKHHHSLVPDEVVDAVGLQLPVIEIRELAVGELVTNANWLKRSW
jgi:hypothetical protein